jgi:hypothetical protein
MFFLPTYFWGNDFATIKSFEKNLFSKLFVFQPVFEEMTLQPKTIFDQKMFLKHFCLPTYFRGNNFAAINNFDQKCFSQNFFLANLFLRE